MNIKPRTASGVLYDGDDFDRLNDLRAAYDLAQQQAERPESLRSTLTSDLADPEVARQRYLDAVDEAAARGTEFVVQDIGAKRWRELVAKHLPRKGNQYDEMVGYNTDTFGDALLKFDDGNRRTVVAPAFGTKSERDEWLDDALSTADFDSILEAALRVNRGRLADPKDVRRSSDQAT